jgi:NADH:ubiquinone oxidoreductase subunit 6 (subunit J)
MFEIIKTVFLCVLVGYVIPTAICVVFAFVVHKGNPFKKSNRNTRNYVFIPVANVCVALVIVTCILPIELFWFIKKKINKFKEWKKKLY